MSHATVTENKRLGEVLSWIKEQQEANLPAPKVKSASEKGGYKRREKNSGAAECVDESEYIAKQRKDLQGLQASE